MPGMLDLRGPVNLSLRTMILQLASTGVSSHNLTLPFSLFYIMQNLPLISLPIQKGGNFALFIMSHSIKYQSPRDYSSVLKQFQTIRVKQRIQKRKKLKHTQHQRIIIFFCPNYVICTFGFYV